jgi:hypothetical protein
VPKPDTVSPHPEGLDIKRVMEKQLPSGRHRVQAYIHHSRIFLLSHNQVAGFDAQLPGDLWTHSTVSYLHTVEAIFCNMSCPFQSDSIYRIMFVCEDLHILEWLKVVCVGPPKGNGHKVHCD